MEENADLSSLYGELADWWPLLSPPEEYEEEAVIFRDIIRSACEHSPKTLLELGSGGGNTASYLKQWFEMTLVDVVPEMLAVSKQLNPECEHIQGDMRTVRLERTFDAVFIHDAILYMCTEDDLFRAIETAYVHCKPGGVALFAPDFTGETFESSTNSGGYDCAGRGLRYLEWTWDPDSSDTTVVSHMTYLLREGAENVRCVHDRHVLGLLSHDTWLKTINRAGFRAKTLSLEDSEIEADLPHLFVGIKPQD